MELSELKSNLNNPRIIRDAKFLKLVESIKSFPKMMAIRPIVIDENNVVQGGNMRLKALEAIGYKEIPDEWVKKVSDLTEEEKKEFIIKDNVGFGEWDWEILANEWNSAELVDWGLDIPSTDIEEKEEQDLGIYPLSIVLNSFEYKLFQTYKSENGLKSDTEAFKELFKAKHESNSL